MSGLAKRSFLTPFWKKRPSLFWLLLLVQLRQHLFCDVVLLVPIKHGARGGIQNEGVASFQRDQLYDGVDLFYDGLGKLILFVEWLAIRRTMSMSSGGPIGLQS